MFTQEVNVDAMYRATELMFGDQAAMILAKLADVIDKAMVDGYEQGLMQGQVNLEAACDASFDAGWENGEAEGLLQGEAVSDEIASDAYDDGYLDGVDHARRRPDLADECVQDIINVRAEDHFNALLDAYDATLVQDSGDETTINYRTYAG